MHINSKKKMKYAILVFRGKFVQMLDEMLINFILFACAFGLACDVGTCSQLLHKNSNLSNQLNMDALKKSEQAFRIV